MTELSWAHFRNCENDTVILVINHELHLSLHVLWTRLKVTNYHASDALFLPQNNAISLELRVHPACWCGGSDPNCNVLLFLWLTWLHHPVAVVDLALLQESWVASFLGWDLHTGGMVAPAGRCPVCKTREQNTIEVAIGASALISIAHLQCIDVLVGSFQM